MKFIKLITRIALIALVATSLSCSKGRNDSPKIGNVYDLMTTSLKLIENLPAKKENESLASTESGARTVEVVRSNHSILSMQESLSDTSSSSSSVPSGSGFSFDTLGKAFAGDPAAIEESSKYTGGVASSPSIGGGPLVYDPAYTGGIQPGLASNAQVAKVICDFYVAFFSFFGRCIASVDGTAIDYKVIFGKDTASCESSIIDALKEFGVSENSITNEALDALSCVSNKLGEVSCSGTDLSGSVFDALGRCGFKFTWN